MLRIIRTDKDYIPYNGCDPLAEFEPGQIADLKIIGNQVTETITDSKEDKSEE